MLAMECEWLTGRDRVFEDFCKLADVRVDRRIFIGVVRAEEWDDGQIIAQEFARWLKGHRHFGVHEELGLVLTSHDDEHGVFVILRGDGTFRSISGLAW